MNLSQKSKYECLQEEIMNLIRKYQIKTTVWEEIADAISINKKNGRRLTNIEASSIAVRKIKRRYEEES